MEDRHNTRQDRQVLAVGAVLRAVRDVMVVTRADPAASGQPGPAPVAVR